MYGLLGVVAIAGPFIHHFWKDKRAVLGGLLPLVFMLLVALMVRSALDGAMGGGTEGAFGEFAREARTEAMKAISVGSGVYVALVASLYFAMVGAKKFLAGRAGG
jgi:hypothetical protein